MIIYSYTSFGSLANYIIILEGITWAIRFLANLINWAIRLWNGKSFVKNKSCTQLWVLLFSGRYLLWRELGFKFLPYNESHTQSSWEKMTKNSSNLDFTVGDFYQTQLKNKICHTWTCLSYYSIFLYIKRHALNFLMDWCNI